MVDQAIPFLHDQRCLDLHPGSFAYHILPSELGCLPGSGSLFQRTVEPGKAEDMTSSPAGLMPEVCNAELSSALSTLSLFHWALEEQDSVGMHTIKT